MSKNLRSPKNQKEHLINLISFNIFKQKNKSIYQHKKEHFLIGLDLISEGKRIDEQLDFWELRLEKLCRENYQLLKSKGKDVDEIMDFFSEKTKEKLK